MSEVQVIRRANCGAPNRVPAGKLAQGLRPACGRCKQPLSGIKPVTVTDSFNEVERSPLAGPARCLGAMVRTVSLSRARHG
jgi:hypothetical protein